MKLLLLCSFPSLLGAQNLVINPSFEQCKPNAKLIACVYNKEPEHFSNTLVGWTTLARSTPDIMFRPDSLTSCNFPKPHTGDISVGFINYLQNEGIGDGRGYHEYLQGTLAEPLKPGSVYTIQFWLYHTDSMAIRHIAWLYQQKTPEILPLATNNIGIFFLERAVPIVQSFSLLDEEPHFVVKEVIQTKKGQWRLVSGTFTANKPYRYFIIGNFFRDSETQVDKQDIVDQMPELLMKDGKYVRKIWRIAYYCIDDVSISVVPENGKKVKVTESTPYTFEKVLFNTGKATLLSGAEEELTTLATYIKENLNVKFEIGGHTDNVGDDAANQRLSEQRAKTVYDYLLQLGVNNNQLSYKGYGETTPKASNDKPEGRQQNRRVECKILK